MTRWKTGACTLRATTLDHEPCDNAVEDCAVIEILLGEVDKVLDCLWCVVIKELDDNVTFCCMKGCCRH